MEGGKNFIDFVIEAKDRAELYDGFLNSDSAQDLKAFFDRENFAVSLEDCEKLAQAKKEFGIEAGKIPPAY
jgi:hypothetical protein